MREEVLHLAQESLKVTERFFQENADAIVEIARLIGATFRQGNKILIFGNGGSAADAQHIAAEFVNRFLFDRAPLPAIALTTDTSILTSISNDADFSLIFTRQIEALGCRGDIAWGISTSGKSPNVIEGFCKAKEMGMVTLAFTGKDGGETLRVADYGLNVNSIRTPRIQETHIIVGHIICELVERELFPSGGGSETGI
ncbi:MAG: phosphoheptose isomerase [Deltaproteobacteria bacterium RBG_13_52_11]|nr:MAG: phosphoheptose isomerase [Deltaproteobacteria bacterium RBG_13_52_11]